MRTDKEEEYGVIALSFSENYAELLKPEIGTK